VEWQQGTIAGYIGIPLFTAAFFLRIWARMHIGEHTRGSKLACFGIVKTGPYKYIKHPLYLSNLMAGAAFAFFHAGFSFSVLGFCIIYGFFLAVLAINENKFLQSINSHVELPITPQYIHNILWNDRYTWLWQIAIIVIIFLKKL
jgi:protein-S-isoprenylcysteine O-methyltransferase Ste14